MPKNKNSVLRIIASFLCIAVGLYTLTISIKGSPSAAWQPAIGVLFIAIGLNGFTAVRLARLEQALKELQNKNREQP